MSDVKYDAARSIVQDQVAGLTPKQAVELKVFLKQNYGIEPTSGGVVVVAGSSGGVAFSTTNGGTVADLNRLMVLLQKARRDGRDDLAAMTERTIIAIATASPDDFDRPL